MNTAKRAGLIIYRMIRAKLRTYMPAPKRIIDLVEQFAANIHTYKSSDYLEEDLRHNFLNPLFHELGWDMEDKGGKGALRDLHYEKTIKAGAPYTETALL